MTVVCPSLLLPFRRVETVARLFCFQYHSLELIIQALPVLSLTVLLGALNISSVVTGAVGRVGGSVWHHSWVNVRQAY